LGSSLSLAGDLRVASKLEFSDTTYFKYSPSPETLEIYSGSARSVAFTSTGGKLHGSWQSDGVISTSDRRLKTEIKPLQRTLLSIVNQPKESPSPSPSPRSDKGEDPAAMWVLRQLRPVSYSFKKGPESKYMRFGFIADELETVIPQVVRMTGSSEYADQKAVAYQDLIALLAAAAQGQQQVIEKQQDRMERLLSDFASLKTELTTLKKEDLELPKKARGKKKKTSKKLKVKSTNSTNSTNSTSSEERSDRFV